jgi:hypothetical protein
MGDITNVSELSIDAGCTYDPANDKMSVKNKVGLYQVAALHDITTQMAATDALQLSVQVDGSTPVGSPIVTGIGIADFPGININGVLGLADPADTTPAVRIQGTKKSGTGVTALAADEIVLQVVNNDNAGVKFYGNGDIANTPWTDYSDYAYPEGWTTYEAKEIFYKLVGTTVFCTYYIRGESNTTGAGFYLPWTCKSNYYILGISCNLDTGTQYLGTIANIDGFIEIHKQFNNSEWAASGTKDVRGSFFFELGTTPP